MNHVLDNPIYNALISGDSQLAQGGDHAKHYPKEMAAFVGLKDNSEAGFEELYHLGMVENVGVFFSPSPISAPRHWNIIDHQELHQMVYQGNAVPESMNNKWIDLNEIQVEEMIDLVSLTQPGPFLQRTIDFGNYIGIIKNNKLVAMAGHRFNPKPYREISAVCTHPDYLGKGYGSTLLNEQIKRILLRGEIPFLHVRKDKPIAIKLYEKLGFQIRADMIANIIEKV